MPQTDNGIHYGRNAELGEDWTEQCLQTKEYPKRTRVVVFVSSVILDCILCMYISFVYILVRLVT